MAEPRPTKLTPDMALEAARKTVEQLVRSGLVEKTDAEQCAADIAKHGRMRMDGYELAKTLDDYAYWDCDFQMAEELNGFQYHARHELAVAQKAWAERNAVSPPLPIGARVTTVRGASGVIAGIYEHGAAQYSVAIDGDPQSGAPHHRRRIVNFEDVEAINA